MPVMQQVGDTKNDATAGVVAGGFVVLASAEDRMVSERRWDRAIRAVAGDAQYRVTDAPSTTWSMAACFTRRNGSAVPIVADPETGSWLAIAGTWFHNSGTTLRNQVSAAAAFFGMPSPVEYISARLVAASFDPCCAALVYQETAACSLSGGIPKPD